MPHTNPQNSTHLDLPAPQFPEGYGPGTPGEVVTHPGAHTAEVVMYPEDARHPTIIHDLQGLNDASDGLRRDLNAAGVADSLPPEVVARGERVRRVLSNIGKRGSGHF